MGKLLPAQSLQYSKFSEQQRLAVEDGEMESKVNYWRSELAESPQALPLLPFSISMARKPVLRYEHNEVGRHIDAKLAGRKKEMCRKQKANLFHFYLAVMEATLLRLLDTEDPWTGMADANRFEGGLSESMGMYLNLLPRLNRGQQFQGALTDTRRKGIRRRGEFSPLFQAFISYRAGVAEKRRRGTVEGAGENIRHETRINVIAPKQFYSADNATVLLDAYSEFLGYFSRDPSASLESAPLPKGTQTPN
ncbi:hypothetical protein DL769_006099 [Monosporascus sp. CRB-8-3]|nr:hypothetical protein DL769_006099 [Monosporascus sp. CRB-8-3]